MRDNIDDENWIGVEKISFFFVEGMQKVFIGMPFLKHLFFSFAKLLNKIFVNVLVI